MKHQLYPHPSEVMTREETIAAVAGRRAHDKVWRSDAALRALVQDLWRMVVRLEDAEAMQQPLREHMDRMGQLQRRVEHALEGCDRLLERP